MPKARRKLRTDYLINLSVLSSSPEADRPCAQIGVMTLIPRIRIAHGIGQNCVTFRYGYDFKIEVDRIIAERLRDDLTKWLEKNPWSR
ncbi:MAG: hypothetical protein QOE90_3513 [Thermoplasmata archaeon]|jgi:hypothetical protein|nr:hypothetical protein [Thermoplasmata archaeon]